MTEKDVGLNEKEKKSVAGLEQTGYKIKHEIP